MSFELLRLLREVDKSAPELEVPAGAWAFLQCIVDSLTPGKERSGCWLSRETIHQRTGISARSQQAHQSALASLGLIEIGKRGRCNRYLVNEARLRGLPSASKSSSMTPAGSADSPVDSADERDTRHQRDLPGTPARSAETSAESAHHHPSHPIDHPSSMRARREPADRSVLDERPASTRKGDGEVPHEGRESSTSEVTSEMLVPWWNDRIAAKSDRFAPASSFSEKILGMVRQRLLEHPDLLHELPFAVVPLADGYRGPLRLTTFVRSAENCEAALAGKYHEKGRDGYPEVKAARESKAKEEARRERRAQRPLPRLTSEPMRLPEHVTAGLEQDIEGGAR